MAGLNRVFILGRLGKDPELRYLQNKTAVCKFNVATSKKYTKKDTNETVEITEWHRITIWGKLGELVFKSLKKGDGALFIGELKTSSYDKDGQKHFATEVVVDEFHFLPTNNKKEGGNSNNSSSNSSNSKSQNSSNEEPPPDFNESFENNPGDDDIPF